MMFNSGVGRFVRLLGNAKMLPPAPVKKKSVWECLFQTVSPMAFAAVLPPVRAKLTAISEPAPRASAPDMGMIAVIPLANAAPAVPAPALAPKQHRGHPPPFQLESLRNKDKVSILCMGTSISVTFLAFWMQTCRDLVSCVTSVPRRGHPRVFAGQGRSHPAQLRTLMASRMGAEGQERLVIKKKKKRKREQQQKRPQNQHPQNHTADLR